jgi:hypothetical protein
MILARRIPGSNNCLNVVFRSRVVAPGIHRAADCTAGRGMQ